MSEPSVEEEEGEQEGEQTIAVPGVSLETLNAVIRGLYAKYPTPAKYNDLATQVKPQLAPTDASKGLTLAKALGLAETTTGAGRGAYLLTDEGKQYGLYLQSENVPGRKDLLQRTILSSSRWKEIVVFLRSNTSRQLKTTDLSAHVASQLKKTWTTRALERYGSNYAGILDAAGLVKYGGGTVTPLPIETLPSVGARGDSREGEIEKGSELEEGHRAQPPAPSPPLKVGIQMPITINIAVDAKDSEAILNLILLIKTVRGEEASPTESGP